MMHILSDSKVWLTLLPDKGRILGLDLGTDTIGVAMCDGSRLIASPLTLIKRRKLSLDLVTLTEAIADYDICALVLGYPLNMDGTAGVRCQSTRAFARALWQSSSLPILLYDERLSTMVVNRAMIEEGDVSRSKRAKQVDKLAATYLLQGVLDSLAQNSQSSSNLNM